MPSESVLARIAEFLQTLWEHPAAAAQFVDSPQTALATHGLSESDLQGVDLASVAGGLAGAGGLSPEGQRVLVGFAQSPPSHGTPVQHIGHITRAVHHDNPTVQKIFVDRHQVFNIDNSVNIDNNGGIINGDVLVAQDNDTTIATGNATAFGAGSHDNVAAGSGGIAAGGNVTQADDGAVVAQGSGSGAGDPGDSGSAEDGHPEDSGHDDEGHDDEGHDDEGHDDEGHDDEGHDDEGHDTPDLSFGEGDTQHDDGSQDGDRAGSHEDGQDGDHGADPTVAGVDPTAAGVDPTAAGVDPTAAGVDPTAAGTDPTLVEGHEDQHGFDQHHGAPETDDPQGQHGPDHGDLLHA